MAEINIPLIIVFSIWGVGLILLRVATGTWFKHMRYRWCFGVGGAMLVVEALFFDCWVKLGFPKYLIEIPEVIEKWIPKQLVELILEKAGVKWIEGVLSIIDGISINGVVLQLIPTLSLASHIFCILPLLLAICTFIGALIAAQKPGTEFLKKSGAGLIGLSLLAILGLLAVLPDLNGLGVQGKFQWMLVTTLLNTSVGNGPWITFFGLLLFVGEGFLELEDHVEQTDSSDNLYLEGDGQ